MNDKSVIKPPDMVTEIVETCDDCGRSFIPDGVTNFLGSSDGDTECSIMTRIAAWCTECYEKRTQAWDQQKEAYDESGTL